MPTKKIILDLDTGIDDALAIAYCLGSHDAELVGVTCTYGNVLVETSVRNTLAILHLFGHDDIPVCKGFSHSMASDGFEVSPVCAMVHGANGIGEVQIPDSPRAVEDVPAVDFLIEAAQTYGKDLIYVPTGTLTTLAAVLEKDPSFKDKIGGIVMMGGALTVDGNTSPASECNIQGDPEAADLVFKSGAEVTMVGLDVTHQTLLTKNETAQWREVGTPSAKFLADMTDYYIDFEIKDSGLAGCGLHDPLAMAVALDNTLVKTFGVNLHVNLEGDLRGRTIGDHMRLNDPHKTVQAAIEVDVPAFMERFMKRTTELVRAH